MRRDNLTKDDFKVDLKNARTKLRECEIGATELIENELAHDDADIKQMVSDIANIVGRIQYMLINEEAKTKTYPRIIIKVEEGLVREVYSNVDGIDVEIADYDILENTGSEQEELEARQSLEETERIIKEENLNCVW